MARRNKKRRTGEEKREHRSRWLHRTVWTPLKLMLLVCVGTGIGFGAYYAFRFLRTSPALAVRSIEVRGVVHSRIQNLLRAGGLEEGMNIFSVHGAEVARKLQKHAWIRQARVERVVPDRIVVEVEEYIPQAMISLEGLYFVDDQGEVFKHVQPGELMDLPLITGISREAFRADPQRSRQLVVDALKALEQFKRAQCMEKRRVAEIHVDELMGYTLILDPSALSVRFGWIAIEQQIPTFCAVLQEIDRQKLQASSVLLDQTERRKWVTVQLDHAATLPSQPGKKNATAEQKREDAKSKHRMTVREN
jgi:cell division protein FtsQ